MTDCICCANMGRLPHLPGQPGAVPGSVVGQMCDPCIAAAFMSTAGLPAHPHAMLPIEELMQ